MKKLCVVAVILLACASVAFGDVNEDLLNVAANKNTTSQMIKNLVKFGANVNASDYDGWTALMLAAEYNTNAEVIKALISAGADVNAEDNNGTTALMLAARYNSNSEVIKALIALGADVFAKNKDGKTALYYAKNDEIKKIIFNSAQ